MKLYNILPRLNQADSKDLGEGLYTWLVPHCDQMESVKNASDKSQADMTVQAKRRSVHPQTWVWL